MVKTKSNKEKIYLFLNGFSINPKIVNSCINRNVPQNNLYWDKQDSFLGFKIRFLSIPFWLEICYKSKIVDLENLLSESNFIVMEKILHYSELEEQKMITYKECILKCSQITEVKNKIQSNPQIKNLLDYFINNYPKYESLRRGNFLFFFPIILSDNVEKIEELFLRLADLLVCGCILDDLYDYKEDLTLNEKNIFVDIEGDKIQSLKVVQKMFYESKKNISEYIPELNIFLEGLFLNSTYKFLKQI